MVYITIFRYNIYGYYFLIYMYVYMYTFKYNNELSNYFFILWHCDLKSKAATVGTSTCTPMQVLPVNILRIREYSACEYTIPRLFRRGTIFILENKKRSIYEAGGSLWAKGCQLLFLYCWQYILTYVSRLFYSFCWLLRKFLKALTIYSFTRNTIIFHFL